MISADGVIRANATTGGSITGQMSVGRYVINDYLLTLSEIEDGYTLTIQRGSDVQTIEMYSLTAEEVEIVRSSLDIVQRLSSISFNINSNMELEVTY